MRARNRVRGEERPTRPLIIESVCVAFMPFHSFGPACHDYQNQEWRRFSQPLVRRPKETGIDFAGLALPQFSRSTRFYSYSAPRVHQTRFLLRSLDRLFFGRWVGTAWMALSSGLLLLIKLFGWAELHPASVNKSFYRRCWRPCRRSNRLVSAIAHSACAGQRYRYTFL